MIYTAAKFAEHLADRGADVRLYGNRHSDAALLADHAGRHVTATFSETGRLHIAALTVDGDLTLTRSLKRIVDLLDLPVPATAAQTAGR